MTPHRRDPRFFQLTDLAKAGDEAAVHELWIQYRFDHAREGDPRDSAPTRPMSEKNNQTKREP